MIPDCLFLSLGSKTIEDITDDIIQLQSEKNFQIKHNNIIENINNYKDYQAYTKKNFYR